MITLAVEPTRTSPHARPLAVLAAYALLGAAFTWPLLRDAHARIASDPGDPILNTSVLVWNATTLPFSARWWDAPHYYPTTGVTTFTENLLGMYPIASPIFWLSENPLLTYNLTLFATWPLSAFAVYLLVRLLVKRDDAAFLAGLAFGFSPYRAVAFGHLQTLATFGVPFALLGLHGYLKTGRWPWLVVFGAAWLQQGLANGYYILYGGLFFGLWTLYFCSPRPMWPRAAALTAAGAVASLPLVPILVTYRGVHEDLGLYRTLNEIRYFSARPGSWLEVWSDVWLWSSVFPQGKDNMFPGLTVVVLAAAGVALPFLRRTSTHADGMARWQRLRMVLGIAVAVSLCAIVLVLVHGPVDTVIGGLPLKIRDLHRAFAVLLLAGIPLLVLTPRTRDALASRSPFPFYAAGTLLFALLACGPELRVGESAVLDPAPYGWLMALPGFNELRVPTQIKMIHLLCLTVTAGIAYAAIRPRRPRSSAWLFGFVVLGLLADGWTTTEPMEPAPVAWNEAEPADWAEPILELPLGPAGDFGATLRAALHHRRVMNGVSGYDPPHYVALKEGLAAHDPELLSTIASLGPIDIVVDGQADPDGALARYAASAPGAMPVANDGVRRVYRVPAVPAPPPLGDRLPIARVRAVRNDQDSPLMHDGRSDTGWGDNPQAPDEWVIVDLGETRTVGGVTQGMGDLLLHFPRRLAIDVSLDGSLWQPAWEGPTFAHTFLGFVRAPRNAELQFSFASRRARFVRLRQLEKFDRMWWVSEIAVHAPPGEPAISPTRR